MSSVTIRKFTTWFLTRLSAAIAHDRQNLGRLTRAHRERAGLHRYLRRVRRDEFQRQRRARARRRSRPLTTLGPAVFDVIVTEACPAPSVTATGGTQRTARRVKLIVCPACATPPLAPGQRDGLRNRAQRNIRPHRPLGAMRPGTCELVIRYRHDCNEVVSPERRCTVSVSLPACVAVR